MALEISGNIELNNGLTLQGCYTRLNPLLDTDGSSIRVMNASWVNQTSYTNGLSEIEPNLNLPVRVDYDRAVDGVDLLDVVSNKIKTQLEGEGFSVVITEL